MHAEALEEFRRPATHISSDKDHRMSTSSSRPITHAPSAASRPNYHSLSHVEVKLEAVDRIQTQVSLNRASLENTVRDIKKAHEHIRRLEDGFNQLSRSYLEHFERLQSDLVRQLEIFKQQVAAATTSTTVGPSGERLDDQTLEIFTRNLSAVSDKANKVDGMELEMQLLKRRMVKLEEQLSQTTITPSREPAVQNGPPQTLHANAPQHSPPTISRAQHPISRQPSHFSHHNPQIEARSQHNHAETHSAGWASVNQNLKRNHTEVAVDGSPKRAKLAALEPRLSGGAIRPEEDTSRPRTDSKDSYPESNASTSFMMYQQEGSDESHAYSQSQRAASGSRYHSPSANSAKGRGRGGRPKKYVHPDAHSAHVAMAAGWPETARREVLDDGQMVSQGPDGQYYAITESVYVSGRRDSMGTVAIPATPKDPYAHTKKTRTKPIRNSDGILIRKDGKPDMRSQSSAANLRKVHARKEEQRVGEGGIYHGSPDSMQHDSRAPSTEAAESPSAVMLQRSESVVETTDRDSDGAHPRADSTQADRTDRILKSIYPHGIEQRGRAYSSTERSPQMTRPSVSDEGRRTSEDHANTTTNDTTPEHRPELLMNGTKEQAHMYRPLPPPSLPTPVSMQFKQPEVSMLTKQEVA
jgi:hypothetical protein